MGTKMVKKCVKKALTKLEDNMIPKVHTRLISLKSSVSMILFYVLLMIIPYFRVSITKEE